MVIPHWQSSRPHAVTQVTGTRANNYAYDTAGNMVKDNERELVYNSFRKPTYIKKGNYWVEFAYSSAGKRYKRSEFGGEKGSLTPILNGDITVFILLAQETRYVDNVEFIRYGGQIIWVSKRYIAGKVLVTTVNNQATTTLAVTATGAMISSILTAYEYCGYAKLAIGIAQAIDGGETAMANFAGGFAKSFAKGQAVTCMLNMATEMISLANLMKRQSSCWIMQGQ